jgi:hypothetical protein
MAGLGINENCEEGPKSERNGSWREKQKCAKSDRRFNTQMELDMDSRYGNTERARDERIGMKAGLNY